jgi:hypothetical protein
MQLSYRALLCSVSCAGVSQEKLPLVGREWVEAKDGFQALPQPWR